jgi:hypothetical protein
MAMLRKLWIRCIEADERIPAIDTVARISRAFRIPSGRPVAEAENKL